MAREVDYLIRPSTTYQHGPRPELAIAILTIYFVLLLPMAITYFRLLGVIIGNPGFVPRGPRWYQRKEEEEAQKRKNRSGHTANTPETADEKVQSRRDTDLESGRAEGDRGRPPASDQDLADLAPGLEKFYSKDVFVCEADGRPIWCSMCLNWKPDRAHHCREVGRCVEKMDHFCPW